MSKIEYRGYIIEYDPPPIPIRSRDWAFMANGFDGAPDSGDNRCGTGPTLEDCKRQINEIEDEYAELMATEQASHEATHMPWML